MKRSLSLLIFIGSFLFLGACAPDSHEQAARVAPTAELPGPTVLDEYGYKIARGATRLPEVNVRFDATTKSMQMTGKLEYLSMKTKTVQKISLELMGQLDKNGFISLQDPNRKESKSGEPRVVAKATCLSEAGGCLSSFIDIYLYSDEIVYHHQIESHQDEVKNAPEEDSDLENTEGGDDEVEGEPGQYVGSIKEDIEKLLDVKPTPPVVPTPKQNPNPTPVKPAAPATPATPAATKSQAIGPVNAGRLENAINVLKYQQNHSSVGFNIMRPQRLTHFSTTELAHIVAQMGTFTAKELPGMTLSVGDLSREKGGKLGSHLSHQNGLDADVAFYFSNKSFQGYFASAVAVDKPHPNWMIETQWKLFKQVVASKMIDRIFIHGTLKKALCNLAIQKGEVESHQREGLAYETLRRLIADKSHDNHFHLRVKCSSAQVRCRQMAEPAHGTGCF